MAHKLLAEKNRGAGSRAEVFCPRCRGRHVVCNGKAKRGAQLYRCRACGRQFVKSPLRPRIPARIWEIIDGLLSHSVQVRIIADVTGISLRWIYERRKRFRDG